MNDLAENQVELEPSKVSRMSLDELEKAFKDLLEEIRRGDKKIDNPFKGSIKSKIK